MTLYSNYIWTLIFPELLLVSLANAGFRVSLIGYAESAPPAAVRDNKNITVRGIPPPWKLPRKPKIAYVLLAPAAALMRALTLSLVMLQGGRKGVILVQNPPSIPTLLVARMVSWFVDGSVSASVKRVLIQT